MDSAAPVRDRPWPACLLLAYATVVILFIPWFVWKGPDAWSISYNLPISLAFFFLTARRVGKRAAIALLVTSSLFFYAWWDPRYLLLLLLSILFNFGIGRDLQRNPRQAVLVAGIVVNLGLLVYFKYTGFVLENLRSLSGREFGGSAIVLPLAISFFTFQQITYLVDSFRRQVTESTFTNYCLFVTFFPQLIAGPIVHHKEMLLPIPSGSRAVASHGI